MSFTFIVRGIPRTAQTKSPKSRKDWQSRVTEAAQSEWARPPFIDELSVAITYFYRDQTQIDVDGIGKLLIDALEGLCFEDDGIVSQVLLRKSRSAGLALSNPPPNLAEALEKYGDFVYVSLSDGPDHAKVAI